MKILFVENHALFAATVVEQFLSPHEITLVSSVDEAIAVLATTAFDVALVDYDLEDGKGVDLVRHVRRANIPLPIVAVSARAEGNEIMSDAGADAVCDKQRFSRIEEKIHDAQRTYGETVCRISFDPPQSGWILVHISSREGSFDIPISYVPRDSLSDLASSALALAEASIPLSVHFNSEPEMTVLSMTPRQDMVDLALARLGPRGRDAGPGSVMLRCSAPSRRMLGALAAAFRDLLNAVTLEAYERDWGHPFPAHLTSRLQEVLRSVGATPPQGREEWYSRPGPPSPFRGALS